MDGRVIAVAKDGLHRFSKSRAEQISLATGLGVVGDAHEGATVQHRSRIAKDPSQPNLRQVHLMQSELFEDLAAKGFDIHPADLGENITTSGVNLLGLPRGTLLRIGDVASLEVTGLRNPCAQIERFRPGLLAAVLDRGPNNELIRKAGIMAIVIQGGLIRPDDRIEIELPEPPFQPLDAV